MQHFANQCLDLARSLLEHNLSAITSEGTLLPFDDEENASCHSAYAALALGEFLRVTGEEQLGPYDLVDLAARCITRQFMGDGSLEEGNDRMEGMACAALALLSFGAAKSRNPVWERLLDNTKQWIDIALMKNIDPNKKVTSLDIIHYIVRFSLDISRKDESGKVIDRFLEQIQEKSSCGFLDNASGRIGKITGVYDLSALKEFTLIRYALQLHTNYSLRDRKLPTFRTYIEKYLKMIPSLVRYDGLGWCYGRQIGAYGQCHCIGLILDAFRDQWFVQAQHSTYLDTLRRLFFFLFSNYIDQEQGFLVLRDEERTSNYLQTSRKGNFDAIWHLSRWARLAKSIRGTLGVHIEPKKTSSRFVLFDKSNKKEQGLFVYSNVESGLQVQLPLVASNEDEHCDSLAFPHCPGVFDWPGDIFQPILIPELTFGNKVTVPSFYGSKCVTGLSFKNSYYFQYEQPDLITRQQVMTSGLGSCKVTWTFSDEKILAEFVYTVKNTIQLDKIRYVIALGAPHSNYRASNTLSLGSESLRAQVEKDDFQCMWQEPLSVVDRPEYRSYWGRIHFLQTLSRLHPLIMRAGQQYRLSISFNPDLIRI